MVDLRSWLLLVQRRLAWFGYEAARRRGSGSSRVFWSRSERRSRDQHQRIVSWSLLGVAHRRGAYWPVVHARSWCSPDVAACWAGSAY